MSTDATAELGTPLVAAGAVGRPRARRAAAARAAVDRWAARRGARGLRRLRRADRAERLGDVRRLHGAGRHRRPFRRWPTGSRSHGTDLGWLAAVVLPADPRVVLRQRLPARRPRRLWPPCARSPSSTSLGVPAVPLLPGRKPRADPLRAAPRWCAGWRPAAVAFLAAQPALVYAFAMQGSVKEIATLWLVPLLAALVADLASRTLRGSAGAAPSGCRSAVAGRCAGGDRAGGGRVARPAAAGGRLDRARRRRPPARVRRCGGRLRGLRACCRFPPCSTRRIRGGRR